MNSQGGPQRVLSSQQCAALPAGWIREEMAGVHGLNTYASRPTVIYRHTNGQRARNKAELQKCLGDRVDLTNFDFFTGRFTAQRNVARPAHSNAPAPAHGGAPAHSASHPQMPNRSTNLYDVSKAAALDSSVFPIKRRKEMLIDRGVTLIRVASGVKTNDARPNSDTGKGNPPRQVYGIKRLDVVRPIDVRSGRKTTVADFSHYVKPLVHATPTIDPESLVESVAAQLLAGRPPIAGQRPDASGMSVNADQPYAQVVPISDDDVAGQERRVVALRRRLAELIKKGPAALTTA